MKTPADFFVKKKNYEEQISLRIHSLIYFLFLFFLTSDAINAMKTSKTAKPLNGNWKIKQERP